MGVWGGTGQLRQLCISALVGLKTLWPPHSGACDLELGFRVQGSAFGRAFHVLGLQVYGLVPKVSCAPVAAAQKFIQAHVAKLHLQAEFP